MGCCDAEYPQAYKEVDRRARKPHRCDECRQTIRPGTVYRFGSGVAEREPFVVRMCQECAATAAAWVRWAREVGVCDCYTVGELAEAIEAGAEEYDDIQREVARRARDAARRLVVQEAAS